MKNGSELNGCTKTLTFEKPLCSRASPESPLAAWKALKVKLHRRSLVGRFGSFWEVPGVQRSGREFDFEASRGPFRILNFTGPFRIWTFVHFFAHHLFFELNLVSRCGYHRNRVWRLFVHPVNCFRVLVLRMFFLWSFDS